MKCKQHKVPFVELNTLNINICSETANVDTHPVCHQLHTGGIIIMKDTSEEEEELVEPVSAHGPKIEEEEQEPEPPEPFEYIDE